MIHWDRVNELRDEVGAEDFDDVIELFLEEVEEVIERLRHNVNLSQLEEDLHFLKGSALSFGFADFSDLCQVGEKKSANGQADTVDIDAVVSVFSQSKSQFVVEFPDKITG